MAQPQLSSEQEYRARVVTWAAMLFSIPMYAVILKVVHPDVVTGNANLENVLLVAAAAVVATSFAVKTAFFQRARASGAGPLIRAGELIAFCLCELAALLGVVLWFLAGSPKSYWLLVLGGVGQILHFPRRES